MIGISTDAQRFAAEAYRAFENNTRGDVSMTVLRDDAPEWVRDAVRRAHGNLLPDDWIYATSRDAFSALSDVDEDTDMQTVWDEFSTAAMDAYTDDRLRWLASHPARLSYCDEAVSDGLCDGSSIAETIGCGQYLEAREIFREIWAAVEYQTEN